MSPRPLCRFVFGCLCFLGIEVDKAIAQTHTWTGSNGVWQTATNWTGGVPTTGSLVVVNRNVEAIITLNSNSAFIRGLNITGSANASGWVRFFGEAILFQENPTINIHRNTLIQTELRGAGALTINSTVSGYAAALSSDNIGAFSGLVKTGTGVFQIAYVNTYSGNTVIKEGTLRAGSDNNTDAAFGARTGNLIFDGGTLEVFPEFSLSRKVIVESGGGRLDIQPNLSVNGRVNLYNDLGGSGTLTLARGTFGLYQANTFAGKIQVMPGGGRLELNGNGSLANGSVELFGGSLVSSSGSRIIGGLSGTAGTVSITSGSLTVVQSVDGQFTGIFSASSASLTKSGTATLQISGSSFSAKTVTVADGALDVNLVGSGTRFDALAVSGTNARFVGRGSSLAVGALSGSGNATIADGHLVVSGTENSSFSGTISTGGSLIKNDSGELVLAGEFKTSGTMAGLVVNGGKVDLVNGATAGGGSIQVNTSGTLSTGGGIARKISSAGYLEASDSISLGDSGVVEGFVSTGVLSVSNHSVLLLSADRIELVGMVRIEDDGGLDSENGIELLGQLQAGKGTIAGEFINNGIVNGPSAGSLVFTDAVSGTGEFVGNITFLGSYAPGNSPASISFAGDVTFGSLSQLTMEIGGTVAGSGYDQLLVSGDLFADGVLNVEFLGGFTTNEGDSFQFFLPGSMVGSFASLILPDLEGGLSWNTDDLYTLGQLSVIPEPAVSAMLLGGGVFLVGRLFLRRRN